MIAPPDKALAFCALLVLLITTTSSIGTAAADGNVGCLFSRSLCTEDIEWCFDDFAFGRCLQANVEDDELYRYDFSKDQLQELEREISRLFSLGYRWSHAYTQCLLQAMLYAFKIGSEFDNSVCDNLKDQDLDTALKAIESDSELQLDPHNMAYVKFTPSVGNPQTDYADEVYFPPQNEEEEEEAFMSQVQDQVQERDDEEDQQRTLERFLPQAKLLADDTPSLQEVEAVFPDMSGGDGYHSGKQFPFSLVRKKSEPRRRSLHFSPYYNAPEYFRAGFETRDLNIPLVQGLKTFSDSYNSPESFRNGVETREKLYPYIDNDNDNDDDGGPVLLPLLTREYNTPDRFRQGFETKDIGDSHLHHRNKQQPYTQQQQEAKLLFERLTDKLIIDDGDIEGGDDGSEKEKTQVNRGYTEGGLVILPRKQTDVEESLSDLLGDLEPGLDNAFKRPERLDVKKPGPLYSINNYAFQGENKSKPHISHPPVDENEEGGGGDGESGMSSSKSQSDHDIQQDSDVVKHATQRETSYAQPSRQVESLPAAMTLEKKMAALSEVEESSDQYDVVDTNFAYIGFKDSINTWQEGRHIANAVAHLLHLPASTFTHIRVDRNEITFKVEPNSRDLNASQIANRIEGIKDQLKQEIGVSVTSAGIGDKTKLPTVLSLGGDSDHELYVATFIVCGVMGAVLLSAAALFVIRRYAASRAKLQNLTAPDTEASKDYQELCRARMAAKPPQEGPPMTAATTAASQRIASLSRESDNSQSSRSSTSSWSEEPALSSMDISTGHMVLSYMEDHLRNKDRLETEWAALCAYEADPCATTIAQRPENSKKNRYVNALPYDHARVVLNELSNLTGSDYINASTITDHDPRNPAYIATQGPLPNTAPDLWQMVWEQGCVVIVMLTRLIENEVAMCHRYWPEEGSELYHIYEVHLVSEHIWCDDYLVRSFYLKNLKTGETRTVTQFHFLSWPDGGVPTSTKALLEFRRKVNKSFRGRSCPIVVHCSDGVGRTGTYCLLDMVLNRMAKGAKEIDIAATLEHIRDQRGGSVATKQQFQLVLAAVAEEVQAILRILPQQQQQQQPPTTTASAQ